MPETMQTLYNHHVTLTELVTALLKCYANTSVMCSAKAYFLGHFQMSNSDNTNSWAYKCKTFALFDSSISMETRWTVFTTKALHEWTMCNIALLSSVVRDFSNIYLLKDINSSNISSNISFNNSNSSNSSYTPFHNSDEKKTTFQNTQQTKREKKPSVRCKNCKSGHSKEKCPSPIPLCYKCGSPLHVEKNCTSKDKTFFGLHVNGTIPEKIKNEIEKFIDSNKSNNNRNKFNQKNREKESNEERERGFCTNIVHSEVSSINKSNSDGQFDEACNLILFSPQQKVIQAALDTMTTVAFADKSLAEKFNLKIEGRKLRVETANGTSSALGEVQLPVYWGKDMNETRVMRVVIIDAPNIKSLIFPLKVFGKTLYSTSNDSVKIGDMQWRAHEKFSFMVPSIFPSWFVNVEDNPNLDTEVIVSPFEDWCEQLFQLKQMYEKEKENIPIENTSKSAFLEEKTFVEEKQKEEKLFVTTVVNEFDENKNHSNDFSDNFNNSNNSNNSSDNSNNSSDDCNKLDEDKIEFGFRKQIQEMGHTLSSEQEEKVRKMEEMLKEDVKKGGIPGVAKNASPYKFSFTDKKSLTITNPRKFPLEQQKVIQEFLNVLLEKGLIRKGSLHEVESVCNIVLIRKKDGSYRFAIDYRPLNKATKLPPNLIPLIDEILRDQDPEAIFFVTIDISSAFWHLPLAEEHQHYTAFWDHLGNIFYWTRVPQGISGAPTHFNYYMLCNTDPRLAQFYFDDLVICGRTMEEVINKAYAVIEKLHSLGLSINPAKVKISQRAKILGFIREKDRYFVDPDRIEGLKLRSNSIKSRKDLRSVIGMINTFHNFVPNLAMKIKKFNELTSEKISFRWNSLLQQELQALINVDIANAFAKYVPRPDRTLYLITDASEEGIGGLLYQEDEKGNVCPIQIFSKQLNHTQSRWAVFDRECYAIVYGISKCRQFLIDREFIVLTDHKPLLSLFSDIKEGKASHRLYRYAIYLQSFKFWVKHIEGKNNKVADALSRYFQKNESELKIEAVLPNESEDHKLFLTNFDSLNMATVAFSERGSEDTVDVFEFCAKTLLVGDKIPNDISDHPVFSVSLKEAQNLLPHLFIRNGVLCYKKNDERDRLLKKNIFNDGFVPYVPVWKRNEFLYHCHNDPTGGHFGIDNTYAKAVEKGFFPGMREAIVEKCKKCVDCQLFKPRSPHFDAPRKTQDTYQAWETLEMDIIDGLPETEDGFKWLFTLRCRSTKFVCLTPLITKDANSIAETLLHLFLTYGIPHKIISDEAKQFCAEINKELALMLDVVRRESVEYHYVSHGLIERTNSTVQQVLRFYANKDPTHWNKFIPFISLALNTYRPRGINHSSFFLMFGRNPRTLADLKLDFVSNNKTIEEWFQQLKTARELSFALEHRMRLKDKENYDNRISNSRIQVGDHVLSAPNKIPNGVNRKIGRIREGPFIVRWIRDTVAGLEDVFNSSKKILERPIVKLTRFQPGEDYKGYIIQEILEEKEFAGEDMFLVKYKDLPDSFNAWLKKEDLISQPNVFIEWNKKKHSIQRGRKGRNKKTFDSDQQSQKNKIKIIDHKQDGKKFLFQIQEEDNGQTKWLSRQEFEDEEIVNEYIRSKKLNVRIVQKKRL